MVAVAIDPATGEIECVNAGHPPVLIVDRDGDRAHRSSRPSNPALGDGAASPMEPERALLEFGDVLAMYTDGLTELRNAAKEMLGKERLGEGFARICAARPGEGSADIAEALRRDARRVRRRPAPRGRPRASSSRSGADAQASRFPGGRRRMSPPGRRAVRDEVRR